MNNTFTFATDIDDVLLTLVKKWINLYNIKWNDNLSINNITDWAIHKIVKPECGDKIFDFLVPEIYNDIEVIEYAQWGIHAVQEKIRQQGKEPRIIYITSNSFNCGVKFDVLNNLEFNIHKDDFFECGSHSKHMINFDYLLDDNLDTIRNCGDRGILFKQPWNANNDIKNVVDGWTDLIGRWEEITSGEKVLA